MTVYITQIPKRRDKETGAWVDAYSVTPAEEYGEVVVMFPHDAVFYSTMDLLTELYKYLDAYDVKNGDYLLPNVSGSPVIASAASAILAKKGPFCVLSWDKNIGRYHKNLITV